MGNGHGTSPVSQPAVVSHSSFTIVRTKPLYAAYRRYRDAKAPVQRRSDIYDGFWEIWWLRKRYVVGWRVYVGGPAVLGVLHRAHRLDHTDGDRRTIRYGLWHAWHA